MKKILFFAATAMLFAACANEEALAPQTAEVAANAISFDTYTASATRAGDPVGVMNTEKLKFAGKGFGVFAMYQNNADYASSTAPNFMFNEHVHWATSWTYSPLKYWPNETIQDSQDSNATTPGTVTPGVGTDPDTYTCDKISFFAYAPYVDLSSGTGTMETNRSSSTPVDAYIGSPAETAGILSYSKENRANDPLVEWKYSTDLDQNVDLLWGVAPNGMAYQSVNPSIYINKTFGLPLLNMVKPDKDQKIKFLFNHALSRIGLSVVSAIDQIAAGDDGAVYNNAQTRVLIKSVEVYGDFGKQGVLNLNNGSANVANWIAESVDKASVSGAALYSFTVANGAIAKDLRYENLSTVTGAADKDAAATAFGKLNTGVLASETTLLAGGADPSKLATGDALKYEFGKTLYTLSGSDYVRATTIQGEDKDAYTKSGTVYTQARAESGSDLSMNGTVQYYKLGLPTPIVISGGTGTGLEATKDYYVEAGSAPNKTYTKMTANGTSDPDGTYYLASSVTETALAGANYTGTCYTGLTPRYFMVIPTGDTDIKVKITYAVVTYDEKLNKYVSDVENEITKSTSLNLENGKSYNLKLILGLTSVKLDATVADWQVDGSTEVNLPRNNE